MAVHARCNRYMSVIVSQVRWAKKASWAHWVFPVHNGCQEARSAGYTLDSPVQVHCHECEKVIWRKKRPGLGNQNSENEYWLTPVKCYTTSQIHLSFDRKAMQQTLHTFYKCNQRIYPTMTLYTHYSCLHFPTWFINTQPQIYTLITASWLTNLIVDSLDHLWSFKNGVG